MGDVEGWTPEFDGQRPPFPPGNDLGVKLQPGHELSTRHGAYSPRRVEPLAAELVDQVLDDPDIPYLQMPSYRLAVWAWARAEAQVQLLTEYLADRAGESGVGDLDDESIRAAYLLLHRAEARADRSRSKLGLDPLSRARLGRDVALGHRAAMDTASIMTQLARLDREGKLPVDGDGVES